MNKLIAAIIAATFSIGAFAQASTPATAAPAATIGKKAEVASSTSVKKAHKKSATKKAKKVKASATPAA